MQNITTWGEAAREAVQLIYDLQPADTPPTTAEQQHQQAISVVKLMRNRLDGIAGRLAITTSQFNHDETTHEKTTLAVKEQITTGPLWWTMTGKLGLKLLRITEEKFIPAGFETGFIGGHALEGHTLGGDTIEGDTIDNTLPRLQQPKGVLIQQQETTRLHLNETTPAINPTTNPAINYNPEKDINLKRQTAQETAQYLARTKLKHQTVQNQHPQNIKTTNIVETLTNTLITKHKDYGNKNITQFGEIGIIIRLNDKIARLENILQKSQTLHHALNNNNVKNETIQDTIIDIIGYSTIGIMWTTTDQNNQKLFNYPIQ